MNACLRPAKLIVTEKACLRACPYDCTPTAITIHALRSPKHRYAAAGLTEHSGLHSFPANPGPARCA